MSDKNDNFQVQVELMPSLDNYLSDHRRSISGHRTLAQAYIKYRWFLMAGIISSSNQNHTIRQMDPRKIDWDTAYKWWKARDDAKMNKMTSICG